MSYIPRKKHEENFVAQTSVVVAHNLQQLEPEIKITDASGENIGFNYTFDNINQLTVDFDGSPQTGKIVVRRII